jgi:hypothetical protein
MSKSNTNNGTMKFTDIDPKKVFIDSVIMNGEAVPLIKYEDKTKTAVFQGPRILMTDYGLAPGEFLSNGEKNEWYRSDETRDTMKFPVDADKCAVVIKDDGTTNAPEIRKFIDFLKALDTHFKTSESIRKAAGIDDDHIEKYMPIYRKAAKPVKKVSDKKDTPIKVKPAYMKTKFHVNNKNKKEIITAFYNVDTETNKTTRVLSEGNYITLEDVEKFYEHKCDQQPVIQLVKVWYKSNGEWGVTLRLVMSRIRKTNKSVKSESFGFIEDDDVQDTKQETKQETKADVQVPSDDSEDEPVKPVQKLKSVSKVDDSDDSDDAPAPKKQPKPPVQQTNDSDSEEVVPVKKPTKQPVKKDVESDDSDDEVVPVKKLPVRGGKSKK